MRVKPLGLQSSLPQFVVDEEQAVGIVLRLSQRLRGLRVEGVEVSDDAVNQSQDVLADGCE
jgi:hypothetical protein